MIVERYPLRLRGGKLGDMFGMQNEMLVNLQVTFEDFKAQLFVDTATWGLAYWEDSLGIVTDPSLPLDVRRERVKSRLRGTGTTTVAAIKRISESFTGYPVDVIEIYHKYEFLINLGGANRTIALSSLTKTIREIKPAHLGFGYMFLNTITNPERFLFHNLTIHTVFRRGGDDAIRFDGKRKFDGTWKFNQRSKKSGFGLNHVVINIPVQTKSRLTVKLKKNWGNKFDGSIKFDGSNKFSSGTIEEEV